MSTLYLNSLQERLRPIARLVFPSDRSLCVNLCNTNQYTRLYLRRIIQLASKKPYELTITIRQLAQLFHVPYKKFLRWFRQDVQSTMVFRRVSHYLQEILLVIIYEELGLWDQLRDRNIPEKPIDWPSRKTMALWKQQADIIRKEYQNRGPKITSLTEAEDLIRLMQGDDFSSDSSESDDEDISHGIIPDEERASSGINYETTDSNALNGKIEKKFTFENNKNIFRTSCHPESGSTS